MLSLIFAICMFCFWGKVMVIGVKAAWGLTKFLLTIVFFPLILLGLVLKGLMIIALPVLIVLCIGALLYSPERV